MADHVLNDQSSSMRSHVAGFGLKQVVLLIVAGTSSMFFARQLHLDGELFVWLALFAMGFLALMKLDFGSFKEHRAVFFFACLFVALFDLSMILGSHIVVNSAYGGLISDNYITPYGKADLLNYVATLPVLAAIVLVPLQILLERRVPCRHTADGDSRHWQDRAMHPLGARAVLFLMVLILAAWLPYLVVYWPGFIFGDSISSLSQALGFSSLSNHHPVAYTLFLEACLKISEALGFGNTIGVGLSSVIQGLIMSFAFAYMSRWISVRANLPFAVSVVVALVFGLASYVATYSVALWKDPLFSVCVLLFSLCLADLVWSEGAVSRKVSWIVLFLLSSFGMVLFRNNGVFVLLASFVAIVVLGFARRDLKKYLRSLLCTVLIVLLFAVITGPVYKAMGVAPSERSESVGIPLSQMARVAALDGEMSESDREYLNEIIPIDEYKQLYTPCCTDTLKWAPGFNNEPLGKEMWAHWLSMLVKNPNVYFQAWELQTFGFWTVNTESQAGWSWNIGGGVPRNVNPSYVDQLADYGVVPNPAALNENVVSALPYNAWSIPIGWLLWLCLYSLMCLCAARREEWLISLVPSLSLVGTLVIASPIWYWPRYGAALQFLIPVYLLLLALPFRGLSKGLPCK